MIATDYVNSNTSPFRAANVLADIWCDHRDKNIDLWGCDFFGREFIETFLERSLHNKCFEEACKINWHFPCETDCRGPGFQELTDEWIENFKNKNQGSQPEDKFFVIQIFRSDDSLLGYWSNTSWGGNDRKKVLDRAKEIAKNPNKLGFTKVRVLEVLKTYEVKES